MKATATALILIAIFTSSAMAAGTVITLPGEALAKHPLAIGEGTWINGTYSSTLISRGLVTFTTRGLGLTSNLEITPNSGVYQWGQAISSGNKIWYSYGRAVVEYEVLDSLFKETITLSEPVTSISWAITLDLSRAAIQTDGDDYIIRLQDETGTAYRIRVHHPVVTDAAGNTRALKFRFDGKARVLSVDQNFGGLVYPLVIDPVYTVDSFGSVGANPMVRINKTGYPYVVYSGGSSTKIAVNESGTWKFTFVPPAPVVYYENYDFDFDPDGFPIIACVATGNTVNLTYRDTSTGKWNTTILGITGTSTSEGRVPVIYNNTLKKLFVLWRNVTGSTSSLNVTTADYNTMPLSLTSTPIRDPTGAYVSPHRMMARMNDTANVINVIYADDSYLLKFLTITPGLSVSPVTTLEATVNGEKARPPWLAIDSTGMPRIVYSNTGGGFYGINFSWLGGGVWHKEQITKNGTFQFLYNSLAFNSSDYAHVSAMDGGTQGNPNGILILARRSAPSTWANVTLDASMPKYGVGWYNSIAIGPDDSVHIVYYDYNNVDLKYYFEPGIPSGSPPTTPVPVTPGFASRGVDEIPVDLTPLALVLMLYPLLGRKRGRT